MDSDNIIYRVAKMASVGDYILCPNCSREFQKKHHLQVFCKTENSNCRDKFWNREKPTVRNTSLNLQKLMNWNYEFAKRVFPEHCKDPVPPLHHLKKEVGETIEELQAPEIDREKLLFEYADCLILLVGSAKRAGLTAEDLLTYSFKKMVINEKRDWGKPDENGVYLHKKGGENG